MANTNYGVNHPLAVKLWSKKLFHEALKTTWAYKFMGTSTNSLIQIKEDLRKSAGDRVRCGLRMLLVEDGVQGDGTLEGNEESLVTYFDDIFIDQLRHAVRSEGKMSEQRVPFSIREESRMGLQDWWADRIDTSFFNQIAGNTAQTDTKYTGNQAAVAADTAHRVWVDGTSTEGSLSNAAAWSMSVGLIDKCVAAAKTLTPMIRPIRIDGGDYYAMFLHPFDVYQLRQQAATAGSWADIQQAAMQGGQITKNPIFSGAIGMWNGVILHEATRIPNITGTPASGAATDYRTPVFAGAQAAALAFGKNSGPGKMSWVEDTFDYGNQLGVSAGMIYGLKKTVFNSADFATLKLATYAPDPSTL